MTDNAANMKAAFNVTFPSIELPDLSDEESEDGPCDVELWHENQDDSVNAIEGERISCFAHSLQLTVLDGLKETKAVSPAMSRAVAVSSLLHRSTAFKVGMIAL